MFTFPPLLAYPPMFLNLFTLAVTPSSVAVTAFEIVISEAVFPFLPSA